jgi:riboflavin biosynthesis pyrimidine reductase
MKPHVTMHMLSSIDGRIITSGWPKDVSSRAGEVYEEIHQSLKGDAWIVGRTTMAEFGKGEAKPATASERYPRTTWRAPAAEKGPFAVAIDQSAKLHLNTDRANGDPIVVALTEQVSDDHLAELRRDGISYFFAGKSDLDLRRVVDVLQSEFGVEKLLLEGGGGINGSFLSAGLIDEISLLFLPLADGVDGPTIFERDDGATAKLKLISVDQLEGGVLHLRYSVVW